MWKKVKKALDNGTVEAGVTLAIVAVVLVAQGVAIAPIA